MRIDRHTDAAEFLSRTEPWLLYSEAENNLIIGIARQSRDRASCADEYWATVYEDDQIAGGAFRTPPYPLGVTRMPADAIPVLLENVSAVYEELPGVAGPASVAEPLAHHWQDRHGGRWRTKFLQRIHVLKVVADIDVPPGTLRPMDDSDESLIWDWMAGFARDAGISVPVERFAGPLLEDRKFFFWEDDGPRSIVSAGRDTPNGACINAVYTPSEYRRNGYATAAVAALSRKLLDSGKQFCCLYTDLNNPSSNSIYRKIGYEPVRDDMELEFEQA